MYERKNNGNGRENKRTIYNKENGSRKHVPEYNKEYYFKNKEKLSEKSRDYYQTKIPKEIREKILERDNQECQVCGQKEFIGIHHHNRDREDNDYWNLLTLCPACHRMAHNGFL